MAISRESPEAVVDSPDFLFSLNDVIDYRTEGDIIALYISLLLSLSHLSHEVYQIVLKCFLGESRLSLFVCSYLADCDELIQISFLRNLLQDATKGQIPGESFIACLRELMERNIKNCFDHNIILFFINSLPQFESSTELRKKVRFALQTIANLVPWKLKIKADLLKCLMSSNSVFRTQIYNIISRIVLTGTQQSDVASSFHNLEVIVDAQILPQLISQQDLSLSCLLEIGEKCEQLLSDYLVHIGTLEYYVSYLNRETQSHIIPSLTTKPIHQVIRVVKRFMKTPEITMRIQRMELSEWVRYHLFVEVQPFDRDPFENFFQTKIGDV